MVVVSWFSWNGLLPQSSFSRANNAHSQPIVWVWKLKQFVLSWDSECQLTLFETFYDSAREVAEWGGGVKNDSEFVPRSGTKFLYYSVFSFFLVKIVNTPKVGDTHQNEGNI